MFHDHKLTRHAAIRMRQRGVRDGDLRLLLEAASQVSSDAYMLTDHDAARGLRYRRPGPVAHDER